MVHGHVLQERRHQYCAGARSQAHTHGAGRTLAQLAPPVTQLVGFSHQGARPSQHLAAEGCEFAVAADAVEQGYAQLLLQRAHAAAEGGLCQMHGLGRAAERAGLRHRYEMPELHQRHDFSRPEVCMKLMLMQPTMHWTDRKSTRLNSSHLVISYAVFCLKKKQHRSSHGPPADCVTCLGECSRCLACPAISQLYHPRSLSHRLHATGYLITLATDRCRLIS